MSDLERLQSLAETGHLTSLAYLIGMALHQARGDLRSAAHELEMRDAKPDDLWRPG